MKKQRDTVTREIAVNPYDIEALEGWLEELAAREGLRLKRCGPGYFVFRRGEPACLRYRTAPAPPGSWWSFTGRRGGSLRTPTAWIFTSSSLRTPGRWSPTPTRTPWPGA